MKKIGLLLLSSLGLLLTNCSMDDLNLQDSGGTGGFGKESGEFYVSLQATDIHLDEELAAKSEETSSLPDVNDFAVDILKGENTIIRHYDAFSEIVGEAIRLNVGSYTLRATHGSATAAGFDAAYYKGEAPFTIQGQQNQTVSATCKLANVKLAVVFGPLIAADYSDYYVDIQSGESPAVRFSKTETRYAYAPAGDLQLTIYMTDKQGATRSYKPDPVVGVAQDFITFTLDTKEQKGELGLTITTDTSVEEKEETVMIPSFMLPKDAPTIACNELVAGETLSYVEGEVKSLKLNFKADGALRGCLLTVHAPELHAKGWPTQIDLANLTEADNDAVALMKEAGLLWFDEVNGATLAYIDFGTLSGKLTTTSGNTTNYAFSVKLTDAFAQTAEATYTLAVNSPTFALQPIAAGDVWSTVAYTKSTVTAGDPNLITLQYKTATSDWADCTVADRVTNEGTITMTAQSLPTTALAGTAVTFRLKYNDHYSAEQTVTTEAMAQVPNSNFDTHCSYKFQSGDDINQYFWYASADATDKWWSTRNPASASQKTGNPIGGKNGYTRNLGANPVGDGKAVELKTTAWGRGNTSIVNGGGTKYNITAGILFIGDYNYQLSEDGGSFPLYVGHGKMTSETITQGRPFTSRPKSMTFDYKYAPLAESGEQFEAYAVIENRTGGTTTELARAQVTAEVAKVAKSTMTSLTLDFEYVAANRGLKATHISIFFASCNKMNWKENTDRPATTNSGTGTLHYGSIFTIDNLILNYDF